MDRLGRLVGDYYSELEQNLTCKCVSYIICHTFIDTKILYFNYAVVELGRSFAVLLVLVFFRLYQQENNRSLFYYTIKKLEFLIQNYIFSHRALFLTQFMF